MEEHCGCPSIMEHLHGESNRVEMKSSNAAEEGGEQSNRAWVQDLHPRQDENRL